MNPRLPLCCDTHLWIICESLSVHGTLWKLGDRLELPGFRKLEYLMRTREHNTRVKATQRRSQMVG